MKESLTNPHFSTMFTPVIAEQVTASSPSVTADGVSISEPPQKARAALYVDGFNLYHAIDELGQPHLKWLNLFSLGSRILNRNKESLVKVRYCTALKPGDTDKNKRHREYITALKWFNVKVQQGHFIEDEMDCRKCGHAWDAPKEKETDVNIALLLFDDAYQDVFDVAYLLTADSDQGATARMLKRRFPKKRLVSVVPPGMDASKAIMTHADDRYTLNAGLIEECLLPAVELDARRGGAVAFQRPKEYHPPAGWVPPDKRPKKQNKAS
ncbi:NYN domain-containing protein [Bradyrhizobium diazoefficiens]|uniref:NYN domain-containing protein n=1 Tax=Bradyrhizobium diazoefficiens TaxID=1355477 RepID=A0A809X7A2_9BRAD|nr:hypothetical protein XF1B_47990 [Bradyrhizobium diazoefficiens]BCE48383.1 hypothetical protein XF4B_47320 [Bradyrhizobium diazoefficiens]BCE91899.1 hypothetical protein XF10B_46970 [Bradyrhizobium diazoefficiens]BCF26827.1 hypothetical protein XF14B_47790 [Bradyrhizobium diazoefficiens]